MSRRRQLLFVVFALLVAAPWSGCASQRQQPSSDVTALAPAPQAGVDFQGSAVHNQGSGVHKSEDVDEANSLGALLQAERALLRAERELAAQQVIVAVPKPANGAVKQTPATELGGAGPCALMCRALGSMDRSARRICELAGDDHERCANAQQRVGSARSRVTRACGVCSSP